MRLISKQKLLNKVIQLASEGYADGILEEYWDSNEARAVDSDAGDTLALFLAREISDVCANKTDLQEALECAERAVSAAAYELQELAEHLAMEARKERKGAPST